jgi:hypothetical protein
MIGDPPPLGMGIELSARRRYVRATKAERRAVDENSPRLTSRPGDVRIPNRAVASAAWGVKITRRRIGGEML